MPDSYFSTEDEHYLQYWDSKESGLMCEIGTVRVVVIFQGSRTTRWANPSGCGHFLVCIYLDDDC